LPKDGRASETGRFFRTTRLEAFSDGVFAIAITLLVLDLAIAPSGTPWERVVDAWPFYLAYVVSFLTIGATWLAHTAITDRLAKADTVLLQLNLLLLLAVSVLPFPTRLVAEGLADVEGERLYVAMYGSVLLGIRLLLHAFSAYAGRAHLFSESELSEPSIERRTLLPVVVCYGVAILVALLLPVLAVGLYCVIAFGLVIPFQELKRLVSRRP
jgi:uncharacterized membrane protein